MSKRERWIDQMCMFSELIKYIFSKTFLSFHHFVAVLLTVVDDAQCSGLIYVN